MAKTSNTQASAVGPAPAKASNLPRPLSTRGNVFTGKVVSAKLPTTITVSWERKEYVPKFERYRTKRTKVAAHVPSGFEVAEGDRVRIAECRPISKTKRFVVIEKLSS